MIKRYKAQIQELEETKNKVSSAFDSVSKPAVAGLPGALTRNRKQFQTGEASSRQNDDLVHFLEHKLEEIEKKLSKTQHEYELLQADYLDL